MSRVCVSRAFQFSLHLLVLFFFGSTLLSLIAPQRSPQRPCYEIIGHTHVQYTLAHTLTHAYTHAHI